MSLASHAPIGRILSGSVKLAAGAQDWQATPDAGFYMQPLFHDMATGETSFLMKMDPGAYAPPHSHERFEEILVLEGDFYDAEHSYGPGDYVVRAIGALHEAGSRQGGVVLIVYRN